MSCHGESSSVVFVNTLDVYPPKQSLTCKFTVKEGEPQCFDENSWVGIFKVGWESSTDVLVKKCLPILGETESDVVLFSNSTEEITFEADELPEESDEEFYQFCFITSKGAVLGASCPFQITEDRSHNGSLSGSLLDLSVGDQKKDDASDLEWCPWYEISGEDVDDTVFVHNKTTLLEKSLAKVIEENNNLRETIELKENDIQNLNNELLELQNQISVTNDLLNDKRKQQISDIQQLDELQLGMEVAKETEVNLKKQINELSKVRDGLIKKLEESKQEIDELTDQLSQQDTIMKEKCLDYEEKLKQMSESVFELKESLVSEKKAMGDLRSDHQEELQNLTRSFDSVLSELATQNECIEKLRLEKQALNERLEHTHLTRDEEIRDLVDTLTRKEQMIRELEKRVEALRIEKQNLMIEAEGRLKDSQDEANIQKSNILKMEAEISEKVSGFREQETALLKELKLSREEGLKNQDLVRMLEEKLQEMKEENYLLREKSDGHSGARHALQVAYKHTQRQLAQVKGDRDILVQQYQSIRQQSMDAECDAEVRELKKKVEDLKLRLCIGANAYKEKFVECKKFQAEIRRLMRINAKSSTIPERSNEELSESASKESCESRAFIPNKGSAKEASEVARSSRIDASNESSKEGADASNTNVKSQDDFPAQAQEKSVLTLTEEIKKLQAENAEKENLLQKSKDETKQAKDEIQMLKDEISKFRNPERKFTQFYEQFYSSSFDPELPIAQQQEQQQQQALASSNNTITPQEVLTVATSSNPTLLQLASETPKSPRSQATGGAEGSTQQATTGTKQSTTTQPQQATVSQTRPTSQQRPAGSSKDSNQYKIFLPPSSLNQTPANTCLSAPYTQTLREPVLLTRPYNGERYNTPSGYPYLSDASKPESTSNPDVLKSSPVFTCPVCNMIFPSDYSDVAATNHVNSHFPEKPSRTKRR